MSNDFCIITCHYNPAGWKSTRRNYQRFLHDISWWDVPVFSAEVAYDDQEFASESSWLKLRGTDSNFVWQKERLLNLLVERLPENYTKIAWIDADIIFLDNDWIKKTKYALNNSGSKLIHLWNKWHLTGPNGSVAETLLSVGHKGQRYLDKENYNPGGAWAGSRDLFPLYDKHIVGGGDRACFEAWMGIDYSCRFVDAPAMQIDYNEWGELAYKKVQKNVTSLEFDLAHMYHGSRNDRQYVNRWIPLTENNYDPKTHITIDSQGLLAFTELAPKNLISRVKNY